MAVVVSRPIISGGTVLRGRPSIVSFGSGRLAMFVRGNRGDGLTLREGSSPRICAPIRGMLACTSLRSDGGRRI